MYKHLIANFKCKCTRTYVALQDLYANNQQMAHGIHDVLESALSQGRAVSAALADDKTHEMSVEGLSNAALLASSILATHGAAEVAI